MNLTPIFILTPLYVQQASLWYLIVSDIWSGQIFDWMCKQNTDWSDYECKRWPGKRGGDGDVDDDARSDTLMICIFVLAKKSIFWWPLPKTPNK